MPTLPRPALPLLLALLALPLLGSRCAIVWPPSDTHALRAGACARVITPVIGVNHSDPIYLAGFDNDRHATGVHDDLWARGVVLESGGTKIAIVVLDLVGYFNNEVQTIRSLVDANLGFDSITVSSTHNHEGPDTMGLWGPDQMTTGVDEMYLDFVNDQVAACIVEADAALAPAALKIVTGSSEATSLEPWPDLVADGKILEALEVTLSDGSVVQTQGDAGPVINPRIPILQVARYVSFEERFQALQDWLADPQNAPGPDLRPVQDVIATLVNYASHPEALGAGNTLLTADFPHYMRETLEARYGGVALYVSADLGVLQGPLDVDVADENGQPVVRRSFAFAERMGELLAERVEHALDREPRWNAGPEIEAISDSFALDVENPFFVALGNLGVFGRRGVTQTQTIDTEVQVLRVGDASIVVTPNELDPQIGDLYRQRIGSHRHVFTIGLGNDEIGYQMEAAKYNPSCFDCFLYVFLGNEEECPSFGTLDCGTTMQNNIGPGADPVLQTRIGDLIDASHP